MVNIRFFVDGQLAAKWVSKQFIPRLGDKVSDASFDVLPPQGHLYTVTAVRWMDANGIQIDLSL